MQLPRETIEYIRDFVFGSPRQCYDKCVHNINYNACINKIKRCPKFIRIQDLPDTQNWFTVYFEKNGTVIPIRSERRYGALGPRRFAWLSIIFGRR